jgi:endogenous inhibitor of DNA gyrase (YacG/DUF329 family)
MANHTYVCFPCRMTVRRPPRMNSWPDNSKMATIRRSAPVRCPKCGDICTWLGTKIPAPPHSKRKEWAALQTWLHEQRASWVASMHHDANKQIESIEKNIANIDAREPNTGRTGAIKVLRKRLAVTQHRRTRLPTMY